MPNHAHAFQLLVNPGAHPDSPYGAEQASVLNSQGLARAWGMIREWPGYEPTPLLNLTGVARRAWVGTVHYKDENRRFGLKSFKPLGGAYAVASLLIETVRNRTGRDDVRIQELLDGQYAEQCADITVTAATDGNHGRSVAWGARMFGCRCVIFINESVSTGREHAIAAFGAQVRRNPGSYDDAVRQAGATAEQMGWHVIPDTTDGEVIAAPRHVTQGYAVMAAEAIEQLPYDDPPTHLFLQAGVGGMAAAGCAQFWQTFGAARPLTILVEPNSCACWFESLKAGRPTALKGELDSLMGGLACGEVSALAWVILSPGAHAAIKIGDDAAADAMRHLAQGGYGDPPLVAGESGVAGLAGFLAVAEDGDARQKLGLTEHSRVMLFGTEGATDPVTYREIVGLHPEEVAV